MTFVLDTDSLPSEHRTDALRDAIAHATVPSLIRLEDAEHVRARLGYWELGGGTSVYSHEGTGLRLTRGPAQLRVAAPERVALALQTGGRGEYRQAGASRVVDPGDLMVVDLSIEYDYWWTGEGGSFAVQVDHEHLGMPADAIRRAAARLDPSSAVHTLVRAHLEHLRASIATIGAIPGAAGPVGSATVELVRALLMDAAAEPLDLTPDARLAAVRHWIHRHLADPALTPQRIADAHGISLRSLYNIWSHPELSLSQWIIHERLEAVRRELSRPDSDRAPISAVARRWGFTDMPYFSRRFRESYGASPRDWRRSH
ncbi:helix-turn-helix domain-containing protein [Cryptosporangium aurantiacum]|uniref:Transcriptional regulator, AraC family n=1 Tax=Cryptosporangium aurantiacum TaxID=134849 RepID=A0A1M7RNI0_9ACTN|nr:helix-turn-helix domain-containing protein [Cryptosporangium aurantiacum]SHN47652.1 transcriptional regulator, AraC family [Cryptosporangium aurantiacum]